MPNSIAPSVALVDIRLIGRMDGIEVAHRLHKQFGTRSIFVTADPIGATTARIDYPCIAVMAKPYLTTALQALAGKVLQRGDANGADAGRRIRRGLA